MIMWERSESCGEGANRVLELPFRAEFVLKKVALCAVNTNRLCVGTRAHLLSVRMKITPLADWLAPELTLQISKLKQLKHILTGETYKK